jgi:hypothetical protein
MDTIHYLSKDRISEHSDRPSVKSYEEYYRIELKTEVRNQYLIDDGNLKDLLLSLRSRITPKVYTTCSFCFSGMQPNMTTTKNAAIANCTVDNYQL